MPANVHARRRGRRASRESRLRVELPRISSTPFRHPREVRPLSAYATRSTRAAAAPPRSEPDRDIWNRLLAHLRTSSPAICRQWFEEIEPLGVAGGVLRLRAHSVVHRDYLARQCATPFAEAAQSVTGRLLSVRFLGPEDDINADAEGRRAEPSAPPAPAAALAVSAPVAVEIPPPAAELPPAASLTPTGALAAAPPADADGRRNGAASAPGPAPSPPAPGPAAFAPPPALSAMDAEHLYDDGLILNPDYGFDNFVVGPGNRLAHAAALAVAANPGRAYNPYFVHGQVGLGKTHLLQAVCLNIRQAKPDAVIYYTSCEGFMTQFMDAVQAGMMSRFRHKFRHVDVLVIDDIHFLAKRDRTQEEFFHTFNSLYQSHKQIVLSSDAPPEEIPDLEDRLVSRFKWGLVTSLDPPCYETRVAILKQKAKIRGLDVPDDVLCYVAAKIDSNIRELEGAIVKLHVLASVDRKPVDLPLAKAALGDNEPRVEPKIQIQTIINAVTDYFGVKVTDLQSKRRQRSIAQPRQVCMFLARKHTRYSLEEIGGYFGGRDHTTVMHAVKTVEDRCETDAEFAQILKALEDKLRAPG